MQSLSKQKSINYNKIIDNSIKIIKKLFINLKINHIFIVKAYVKLTIKINHR